MRAVLTPASLLLVGFALSLPASPAAAAPKRTAVPLPAAAGSLVGVKIGMDRDDADALLTAQGASDGGKSAAQDKKAGLDKDLTNQKGKGADPDDALPEIWTLKGTPYEKVAFGADDNDKIIWVTGFARAGRGVPFAQLGTLARAAASGPTFAVWNVISPAGSYRVIARGRDGKALTVTLLPLKSANPNGAFSPQIIPKQIIPKQIIPKQIIPKAMTKRSTGTNIPK